MDITPHPDAEREFEDGDIICPECRKGRIEVSTKIYFDVEGIMVDDPEHGPTADIRVLHVSPVNDMIGDQPFNTESELFVGCEVCGAEFPAVFGDAIMDDMDRQADRR